MIDSYPQEPVAEEIEADAATLAAIDRGIEDADEGRTVTIAEARMRISAWISKFESQKRH